MPSGKRPHSEPAGGRISPEATNPPADQPSAESNGDPLHALISSLGALREEVRLLYEVRMDQMRVAVRDFVSGAVTKFVGWLSALMLGFLAASFVMYGTALGLAKLFGDRLWAGFLLAGLLLFGSIGAVVITLAIRDRRRIRERLKDKYDTNVPSN